MGAHRYHPGMLPCGHVMNVGHRVDRRKVGGCWAHGFGWHASMSYRIQCRLRVCWPRRVACMVHRSLAWSRSLSLHKYTPYWSQTPWHRLFTFYTPVSFVSHTVASGFRLYLPYRLLNTFSSFKEGSRRTPDLLFPRFTMAILDPIVGVALSPQHAFRSSMYSRHVVKAPWN